MRIKETTNLYDLFQQRVAMTPDAVAFRQYDGMEWREMTWAEAAEGVRRWQGALAKEGLQPGDRVAVSMPNRIEWVLFDQAALGMGLVSVPLFYNDRPDNMAWCLNHAEAKFLLLDNGALWPQMRDELEHMSRVVCVHDTPEGDDRAMDLEDWLAAAGEAPPPHDIQPQDLATLVYTSGTTGRPKGVMLSHNNIVSDVMGMSQACPQIDHRDRFLSFLPLSHTFERTVGYYIAVAIGAQTAYARSIQTLSEDMLSQRPTVMVCVPRIFERVYTKVQESLEPGSPKQKLFDKAVDVGWKQFRHRASMSDKMLHPLLDTLVGKKVRARLGGRVRYILLGGAPMPHHLFEVFIGLGLTFLHGYGLTETSPVISFNRVNDNEPFSVGRPLEGVQVRTDDKGELLVRGPIVMLGYWRNEDATRDAIDSEYWFHTGDLAQIRDGRIYITGRVKDIIVLTNGEKVSPGDAEHAILADPAFEQVMVVGEGRPKLGLLAVTHLTDLKEICDRANQQLHDFPGYARICHVARFDEPWTVENGLLTPTLKLKRNVIKERFTAEIEEMYKTDLSKNQ